MSSDEEHKTVPRRDFLSVAVAGSAAAFAAASGYPVVRYLDPPARAPTGPTLVGKLEEFPVGTVRTVLVDERPVFVHRTADEVRAFSALCTHLQCVVQYSPDRGQFECPCHGGVYAMDGTNVAGPPPRPLEELTVMVTDGIVLVRAG
jgi:Rieske Fe-S protein